MLSCKNIKRNSRVINIVSSLLSFTEKIPKIFIKELRKFFFLSSCLELNTVYYFIYTVDCPGFLFL